MLTLPELRYLIRASGLPSAERFVYAAIAMHTNGTPECWPSLAELADCTGHSTRTVRRSLRALEDGGFIVSTRRAGDTTVYRLASRPTVEGGQGVRADTTSPEVKDLSKTSHAKQGLGEGPPSADTVSARTVCPPSHAGRDAKVDPKGGGHVSPSRCRTEWRRALLADGTLRRRAAALPEWAAQAAARGELPSGAHVPGVEAAAGVVRRFEQREAEQERPRRMTQAEKIMANEEDHSWRKLIRR